MQTFAVDRRTSIHESTRLPPLYRSTDEKLGQISLKPINIDDTWIQEMRAIPILSEQMKASGVTRNQVAQLRKF